MPRRDGAGRPKLDDPKSNKVSMRLSGEELKRFEAYAKRHGLSKADTLRRAVDELISKVIQAERAREERALFCRYVLINGTQVFIITFGLATPNAGKRSLRSCSYGYGKSNKNIRKELQRSSGNRRMLFLSFITLLLSLYMRRRCKKWLRVGLLIVLGIAVWFIGAVKSDMDESITENKLQTKGIYAWVRNPMYSGWWMALSGITLMWHNAWMLILPVIDRAIMTIALINTEEKWLLDLYGDEYAEYKKHVNRCIPWKRGS